jgi:hypothetical protein
MDQVIYSFSVNPKEEIRCPIVKDEPDVFHNSFPSSRLGTPLYAKLLLGDSRAAFQGAGCGAKQSFQDKRVPKQELGNQKRSELITGH